MMFRQTYEGVGLTKQKAKVAAAQLALRHGFVQFADVEPVNRILLRRRRDVTDPPPRDDVIDFTADDESPPTSSLTSLASENDVVVVGDDIMRLTGRHRGAEGR